MRLQRERNRSALIGLLAGLLGAALAGEAVRANTIRVSSDPSGLPGDGQSREPALDSSGRFVAFESDATDLVPGDTNGERDIFVRDRLLGLTNRISVSSSGAQANGDSNGAALDAKGRFVAFVSSASNLVAGDTNGVVDVFVHDLRTGETSRVNVSSAGAQANNGSLTAAIDAKGRFVAFHSSADNLVAGDTNGLDDVFIHDRKTGETTRVSVGSAGTQANAGCFTPALDAKGRFVAFSSSADNLVAGDTNDETDIFVHDRKTGETTRVSVSSGGVQGNGDSQLPALDAKGRFVAFQSLASNLVAGDTNGQRDVFVHDRKTGGTSRVSVGNTGAQGNNASGDPDLDARGRFVAFESSASNLVAADTNDASDVFVHDLLTGGTRRVSVANGGGQSTAGSFDPSLDATGTVVGFDSDGLDVVPPQRDVFIHFD
jgi:Tol biopolymer transport system component